MLMNKRINSSGYPTYYCWAVIEGGHIVELGDEKGQGGGVLWFRGPDTAEELSKYLEYCAGSFGFDWYRKVRNEAHADNLPTDVSVKRQIKNRRIRMAEKDVEYAKEQLKEAERALRRAQEM
jgi:hypothetical protein